MLNLIYIAGAALILIGIGFAFLTPKTDDHKPNLNYARHFDRWSRETLQLIADGEVTCAQIRNKDLDFNYKKALKNYQTPAMKSMIKMVAEIKVDESDLS